jgi:rSAM/selenodomain-associated transferase 1
VSPIGLGLMCKPPRPGTTKTRLAAQVGAEAAALLSAAFLSDCAEAVREAGRLVALDPVAFYKPEGAAHELRGVLGRDWPLVYADSGELGATMSDSLAGLIRRCPSGALLMGSDIPLIRPADIAEAADALSQGTARTVVIAPSADGGYCLIGIRSVAATASLFQAMAWSTAHVFEETLRRAQNAGLHVTVLGKQRDIDDANDLDWLRAVIGQTSSCAHATRNALSNLTITSEGRTT